MLRPIVIAGLLAGCDVVWSVDRVPPRPPDAPPPPCSITDDFTGMQLATTWSEHSGGAMFTITQDDELKLGLPVLAMPGEASVLYTRAFDMVGGSIEVEVPQVVNRSGNIENYIRLRKTGDDGNNYTIRYGDGELAFRVRVNSADQGQTRLYDAINHRFWRISNEGENVVFSTRATTDDEWFVQRSSSAVHRFDNLEIMLAAGSYETGAQDPGLAIYDTFKLCGARLL
ncbi:MAG TPA: hypothetical protein VIV11_34490 [Kofleriaceae bacterium]